MVTTTRNPRPAKKTPVTRTIAGHTFTLAAGRRYLASRPVATRYYESFTVTITDISDGYSPDATPADAVPGLSYDQANELLAAFNNGETSFEGRVW